MALIYSSSDPSIDIVDGYNILAERDGSAVFIASSSIQTKKNAISNKDELEKNKNDVTKYPTVGAMIGYYLDHQATGPQGVQGNRGYQGFQGAPGSGGGTGSQGPQGERGYQGFQGEVGGSGGSGSQGPQGYQGDQGPQGAPGTTGSDYWVTDKETCEGGGKLGADYNIYGVAFFQGSDVRRKRNIEEITGALENISKIPTVKYQYGNSEQVHLGTIAQEIESFIPEIVQVGDTEDHFRSVTYPELAVYGLAALKELVELLKTKKII